MTLDAYMAMAHGVQALRRRVERDHALLGAMGIAAEPLPHQLANVRRLLEAAELRHLLADGVGLGKTVQTLMLLNALRLQDPAHRSLLIVPDHLVSQWIQELSTRGHCSADFLDVDDADDADDADDVLLGPVRLVKPSTMSPYLKEGGQRFDLLVVDEPQSFTIAQRDELARARPFAQFLALTATPELGRLQMLRWFVTMLEPYRRGTEADPLEAIRADEAAALKYIEAGGDARSAFARDAFGRRICRWSREDWPDYMPRRVFSRADVPTFAAEAALAKTARKVMNGLTINEPELRARALHRLGRASRDALAALPSGLHDEPEDADAPLGDSKLDALLDFLAETRARAPEARVLIVAGDNDTVARLDRILQIFLQEEGEERTTQVARLARVERLATDTETAIRTNVDAVGTFVRGQGDILLIGDWAESGLNLHHDCDNLVLYACPWSERSVDQLIGRLDRIRAGVAFNVAADRGQGRIRIHVITWQDSPESDVVDGLERLGTFERPNPPMSVEKGAMITAQLRNLAAGTKREEALQSLGQIGGDGGADLEASALASFDLYTAAAARTSRVGVKDLAGGLKTGSDDLRARCREEKHFLNWLRALKASKLIELQTYQDHAKDGSKYTSVWYPDLGIHDRIAERPYRLDLFDRQREMDKRANARSGQVAFLHNRRHLSDPPLRSVTDREGEVRSLSFADHGDLFHEQLCEVFLDAAKRAVETSAPPVVQVGYPSGHPALSKLDPVLITAISVGIALRLEGPSDWKDILANLHPEDTAFVRRYALAGVRADDRWLKLAAPGKFLLDGYRLNRADGKLEQVPSSELTLLLDPRCDTGAVIVKRPMMSLPEIEKLKGVAIHRWDKARAITLSAPDENTFLHRISVIEADARRYEADARRRAAAFRAQMTPDVKQARIPEARANRVEQEVRASEALRTRRLDRLSPRSLRHERTVWQLILTPFERT